MVHETKEILYSSYKSVCDSKGLKAEEKDIWLLKMFNYPTIQTKVDRAILSAEQESKRLSGQIR